MRKMKYGHLRYGVGTGIAAFRRIFVRRNYKDRLFVKLFHDRSELLQLYNALNGSNYQDPEELRITTMEDAVYMGMKNDCSFIIGNYLNLYEHQSTFCPNMPVRGFLYLAAIYQGYIEEQGANLYGTKQIMLPTPKYIVFYNGTEEHPDVEELRLSDSFAEENGCLEFTAKMYNINQGHNPELMEQSKTLAGYAKLIELVRTYQHDGMPLAEAIDTACRYCIEHDILREFLLKNRSEVMKVLLTEYDAKKQRKMDMQDAREDGKIEGIARGEQDFAQLTEYLLRDGRSDDLLTAVKDESIRQQLYKQYKIRP